MRQFCFAVVAGLGILISPFVLMAAYLSLSRNQLVFESESDWLAQIICTAVGVALIVFVPVPRSPAHFWLIRVAIGLLYCIACYNILEYFALYFIGMAFGRWL